MSFAYSTKVKTPSKFLSLDFLVELQQNNYISAGGHEYHAEEVDLLVAEKGNAMMDRVSDEFMEFAMDMAEMAAADEVLPDWVTEGLEPVAVEAAAVTTIETAAPAAQSFIVGVIKMGIKIAENLLCGEKWTTFKTTGLDAEYEARADVWGVVFEDYEGTPGVMYGCRVETTVDVYYLGEFLAVRRASKRPATPIAILWGKSRNEAHRSFASGRWWNDTGALCSVSVGCAGHSPVVKFPR